MGYDNAACPISSWCYSQLLRNLPDTIFTLKATVPRSKVKSAKWVTHAQLLVLMVIYAQFQPSTVYGCWVIVQTRSVKNDKFRVTMPRSNVKILHIIQLVDTKEVHTNTWKCHPLSFAVFGWLADYLTDCPTHSHTHWVTFLLWIQV